MDRGGETERDAPCGRGARKDAAPRPAEAGRVPLAVVVADRDGLVSHWSSGARRLFGVAGPDAIGRPAADLLPVAGALPEEDGALCEAYPDGAYPDGAYPDGAYPDGASPDGDGLGPRSGRRGRASGGRPPRSRGPSSGTRSPPWRPLRTWPSSGRTSPNPACRWWTSAAATAPGPGSSPTASRMSWAPACPRRPSSTPGERTPPGRPPTAYWTSRRRIETETLHAELGDADVYPRGVLHQAEPDDRQRMVDSVAALLGERERAFPVELSEAAKPVLPALARSPAGPPPRLAPVFRHGTAPGEVADDAVPRYPRAAGLTVPASGELPPPRTRSGPDGTRIEPPSTWLLAGRAG